MNNAPLCHRPYVACENNYYLHLAPGTPLDPRACLGCGCGGLHPVENTIVQHVPQAVPALAFLVNPLLGLLAYFVLRDTRRLTLPLCARCARRQRWARRALPLGSAVSTTLALVGLTLTLLGTTWSWLPPALGLYAQMLPAALIVLAYVSVMAGFLGAARGVRMAVPPCSYQLAYGETPTEVLKLTGVHPTAMAAACAPTYPRAPSAQSTRKQYAGFSALSP